MSEKEPEVDSKAKFREALEKKRSSGSRPRENKSDSRTSTGGPMRGKSPRLFRRKSGSA